MKYIPAVLTLLCSLGLSAREARKYPIRIQRPWRRGSVMDATLNIQTKISITSVADGRVDNRITTREYHLQCRLTVLQTNGDGQWTRLSVVPAKLQLRTSSNTAKEARLRKFSAPGRIILVSRKPEGVVYKRADGLGLTLSDEQLLKSFFSSSNKITPDDSFGPVRAVAVDEKWPVNAAKLSKLFNNTVALIQVDPKDISGNLRLSLPKEPELAGLLRVKGDIELKNLRVAPRVANVENGQAQAKMGIEYLLPTNTELPRRAAVMDFRWSVSGPVKGKPGERLAMQHQTLKKETLQLVQEAKAP